MCLLLDRKETNIISRTEFRQKLSHEMCHISKEGLASVNEEPVQESGVWLGSNRQSVAAEPRVGRSNACLPKAVAKEGGEYGMGWDE